MWRGDHHDQFIDASAVACVAHRPGVARREDRLRQHEADPAVVGLGEPDREGEELGRGVGVRPAAVPARAPAGRRRRHLREERRVADDHVEPAPSPVEREGVGGDQLGAGHVGRGERARVDVDTGQRRVATEGARRRAADSEEPSVAARRVEHPHRRSCSPIGGRERVVDRAVDDEVDELVGRVPGAQLLARAAVDSVVGTPRA